MHAEDLAELVMLTWEGVLLRMKIRKTDYAPVLYIDNFFELLKNPIYKHQNLINMKNAPREVIEAWISGFMFANRNIWSNNSTNEINRCY